MIKNKYIWTLIIFFCLVSCHSVRYSEEITLNELIEFSLEQNIDTNNIFILKKNYKNYILNNIKDSLIISAQLQPLQIFFLENREVVSFNANCFVPGKFSYLLQLSLDWNGEKLYDQYPPKDNNYLKAKLDLDSLKNNLISLNDERIIIQGNSILVFLGMQFPDHSIDLINFIREYNSQNDNLEISYIFTDELYNYNYLFVDY